MNLLTKQRIEGENIAYLNQHQAHRTTKIFKKKCHQLETACHQSRDLEEKENKKKGKRKNSHPVETTYPHSCEPKEKKTLIS